MVDIIPKVPTFGERIGGSFGRGAGKGFSEALDTKEKHRQLMKENEDIFRETGIKLSSLDPDMRKQEFSEKLKGQKEEKNRKSMFAFGDKFQKDNPNNPLYQTIGDIYKSDLPPNEASNMVKAITGIDPFKVQQQKRLQLDSVLKRYTSRIKELDDEIKNVRNPNSTGKEEVNALKNQRAALRGERDELLGFKALMEEEDEIDEVANGDFGLEEDEFDLDEEEEAPKVKFDPNNKGHRAAAEKLFKKYGNKEKVREILSKQFKGL